MPLLTNSEVRTYRDCPRKHLYRYSQGWRPKTDAHALRFGSAWHDLLEQMKTGRSPVVDRERYRLSELDVVQLEVLIEGYAIHWGGFSPTHESEVPFEAPLLHPDTWEEHPSLRLAGKIDGLQPIEGAKRADPPPWELWEHKTASDISDDYWSRLQMDSQLCQYVVGSESLGRPVAEIVYDVVRKPGTEPLKATPIPKRRRKKDGTYYANVRLEDETLDDYGLRLQADVADRPDHYFQRRRLARIESQIREHLLNCWDWAELMDGPAPQNPDACMRFGVCSYWSCCSTGTQPSEHPDLYRQIENRHPELV